MKLNVSDGDSRCSSLIKCSGERYRTVSLRRTKNRPKRYRRDVRRFQKVVQRLVEVGLGEIIGFHHARPSASLCLGRQKETPHRAEKGSDVTIGMQSTDPSRVSSGKSVASHVPNIRVC